MSIRRTTLHVAAVAALVATAFGVQTAFTAAPSAPSTIIAVDPARILDTREPLGVPTIARVPANSSITLQVTGVGGVPLNATGVILTLTAVNASVPTFITATPTGTTRSTTSVLNPGGSAAIANTITIALGTGGKIDLYNLAGSVDLIADVNGYLVPVGGGSATESIELSAYNATGTNLGAPTTFGCVSLGSAGELVLDVPLPHGAIVTNVRYRWFDSDQANFLMVLNETTGGFPGIPAAGGLTGGQAQSTGAAGYGASTEAVTGGTEVSDSVRYHIVAFTLGQATGGQHHFCGATVTYIEVS